MDTKKFDYTDLIDMDCKNQTAKLLENYFHRMRGEYDSIVAVEEETYSEQPFFEFVEHIREPENWNIVNRVVQYVEQFVLNAETGNAFNIEVFKTYLYNLDPLFDKVFAFAIASLLNEKDVFASEFDFETAWMSTLNLLKQQLVEKKDTSVDTSELVIGMTIKNYKSLVQDISVSGYLQMKKEEFMRLLFHLASKISVNNWEYRKEEYTHSEKLLIPT